MPRVEEIITERRGGLVGERQGVGRAKSDLPALHTGSLPLLAYVPCSTGHFIYM